MRKSNSNQVVAILCSDIHLSHTAPSARSVEPSWYDAMARQLKELRKLKKQYKVPVIIAGDLFDRWNAPAELINFAMSELPKDTYAIPGQHDMPGHNFDSIKRSAYWTLVSAERIEHIPDDVMIPLFTFDVQLFGYRWGVEVPTEEETENLKERFAKANKEQINLAVIHKYMWMGTAKYNDAPANARALKMLSTLLPYIDSAVIGDNHKAWSTSNVINCGTFFRRTIDDIDHKPRVGLLQKDGQIAHHYLDISEDKYIDVDRLRKVGEQALELIEFVGNLKTLGSGSIDFIDAVKQAIDANKIAKSIAAEIMQALGV